jgi:predicted unusual protein kinase regulating ubiquinone biosynthesis (AarF/ABC1/UbiB family)
MGRIPEDTWSRSKSMLGLAAGVAKHELGHRFRALTGSAAKGQASEHATRIEQALLLVETLGRLKGALMKAGQLLSMDAGDFLPAEALAILSKLQGEAEPVDFAVMRAVLVEELGEDRLRLLEGLSEVPAASASIGQVYRATAFGAPVAVKVQYPGVRESIDSDLAILQKIGSGALFLGGRSIDTSGVFDELRTVLHLEADYARERDFLLRFGQLVVDDRRYTVPRPVLELSSTRVLTMSWEEGETLGAWIRGEPPAEDRTRVACALLDLYCAEFFRWGIVQTDPNFGNFLVRQGGREIVLLDFGATIEFTLEFRRAYVQLLRAIAVHEPARILDEAIALGLLDARESPSTRALFVEMLTSAIEPFEAHTQPFAFSRADYAARTRDAVRRFVQALRYSPPPRSLLFLHRKLGGLFQLLRRLDVALDLRPYWDQMVKGADALSPT